MNLARLFTLVAKLRALAGCGELLGEDLGEYAAHLSRSSSAPAPHTSDLSSHPTHAQKRWFSHAR